MLLFYWLISIFNIKFYNEVQCYLSSFSVKPQYSIFRSSYGHVCTVPFKNLKAFIFKTSHQSAKDIIISIYNLYSLEIITWQLGCFFLTTILMLVLTVLLTIHWHLISRKTILVNVSITLIWQTWDRPLKKRKELIDTQVTTLVLVLIW